MTVSSMKLVQMANQLASDVESQPLVRLGSRTSDVCLEIWDHDQVARILISITDKVRATVVEGTCNAEITLKVSLDTAKEIQIGTISVSEAITLGKVKISGAVSDVIAMAQDLNVASE